MQGIFERPRSTLIMSGARHLGFIARTVIVRNSDVDGAYRGLDRILRNHNVLETVRRQMYYEKPYQKRNRLSSEKCRRIYNTDMRRKIEFLMRKNRADPWPR